jgi:hypothetical protein
MERHRDTIQTLVDETPDMTIEEIRTGLAARFPASRARRKRPELVGFAPPSNASLA